MLFAKWDFRTTNNRFGCLFCHTFWGILCTTVRTRFIFIWLWQERSTPVWPCIPPKQRLMYSILLFYLQTDVHSTKQVNVWVTFSPFFDHMRTSHWLDCMIASPCLTTLYTALAADVKVGMYRHRVHGLINCCTKLLAATSCTCMSHGRLRCAYAERYFYMQKHMHVDLGHERDQNVGLTLCWNHMQGTDVRLSGHFVYCTLPDFKDGPPVRCTNRGKVRTHNFESSWYAHGLRAWPILYKPALTSTSSLNVSCHARC